MRRAVLFDLDDTLLVDEPEVDACFRRVTAEVDVAAGVEAGTVAASVRAAARGVWRASPLAALARRLGFSSWEGLAADFTGGHPVVEPFRDWAPAYRVCSWTEGLAEYDAADRSRDLAYRYRDERRRGYRLFPEALDVLGDLRSAGWRLGIVTNGPPDLQRDKVRTTGIEEYVDVVVVSGEVGVGKPDRVIFEVALGNLGVAPSAAVMVGDSVERDMKGAHRHGMRTVWRRSSGGVTSWQPAVTSLRELPGVLEAT